MKKYSIIIIAVALNFFFFFLLLEVNGLSLDKLFKITGDSIGYVESSESLINNGVMVYQKTAENKKFISNFKADDPVNEGILYAFRSPGFTFFYYPIRLIFSQNISLILFLFFQVLITGLAKYLLYKIVYNITKNKLLSYIAFTFALITPYFSQFNNLLLTDSLGGAFFLFSVFFLLQWKSKQTVKSLIISGLFFSLSFFLRPFLLLLLLPIWVFLFVESKFIFKKILINFILFHSIFGVLEVLWVVRNYSLTDKFIPVATTLEFQDTKHKSFHTLKTICLNKGVSMNWWDSRSPINWYINTDNLNSDKVKQDFGSAEYQLILESKTLFQQSLNPSNSKLERQNLENKSEELLNKIVVKQKEAGFINYFIIPRTKNTFNFINQRSHKIFTAWKYPFNIVLQGTLIFIFKTIVFIFTSLIHW